MPQTVAMVWRNTGSMYFNGIYYSKDEKRAFELYKLAAYEDVPIAQFQLGKMYDLNFASDL
jgi:TPR repeat protein